MKGGPGSRDLDGEVHAERRDGPSARGDRLGQREEEELRERTALLDTVEQLVQLGHWDRDLRTGETRWSNEIYRIFGYPVAAIRPSREALIRAVVPADRDRVDVVTSATARDGVTRRTEFRLTRPSGELRTVVSTIALLRDSQGHPARLFGTAQDVTDQRQDHELLHANEERLRLALAASGEGLWDWDIRTDRAYLSPEYLQLLGYRDGVVPSARAFFRANVHPDDWPTVENTMRAHLQGQLPRSIIEYRMRTPAGAYRWVYGVGQVTARDAQGNPVRMTGVIIDITERKELETALEEALQSRDELLAAVSHDLRTPLSSIRTSADRLMHTASAVEAPGVETIIRSSQRMTRLIDDLLQAATIDAGTFALQKAREEVLPIVDELLAEFAPIAEKRSVRVVSELTEPLPAIDADRQRLMQVLANLVGNAVKFVATGGTVRLGAHAQDVFVVFAVSDDGPGIAEEQLSHVFDRYWTGAGERRRGVGLGLFIAKAIVEAHGGHIHVDSHLGVGTTFTFTIPIAGALQSAWGS